VRTRGKGNQGAVPLAEFIAKAKAAGREPIAERSDGCERAAGNHPVLVSALASDRRGPRRQFMVSTEGNLWSNVIDSKVRRRPGRKNA